MLPPHTTVPINWVAVGNPGQLFPPDQHEAIWKVQQYMGFNHQVYGLPEHFQGSKMQFITQVMSERLASSES